MALQDSVSALSEQAGFSRRGFLLSGLLGVGGVIGGAWLASRITDGQGLVLLSEAQVLGSKEQEMLHVHADAILHEMLSGDPSKRQEELHWILQNMDAAIAALPKPLREDTLQLLGLLAFAPARWLLTARWSGWHEVSREDALAWLEALRDSDKNLRRIVFRVLRDLTTGAFYGDRRSWGSFHYPGPVLDLGR